MKRDRIRHGLLAPLFMIIIVLGSAAAAHAATTINVTTFGDTGTGSGDCLTTDQACSLRQAITAEDGTSGGDTISLPAGNYTLTQGTNLDITVPVTLNGAGVGSTKIDGSQNSGTNPYGATARILRVDSGANPVLIRGITFTGGYDETDEACSSGCNTINANGGGDLFNDGGNVTLDGVAFTNNYSSATPIGGAVSNGYGTLTMNNVSFIHDAAGVAGALFTRNGTVSGNGVTFSEDATTCCEGSAAYFLGGTVTLVNTTIANSGGYDGGAAVVNGGANLTLDNDTLSSSAAIQTDTSAVGTTVENTILGAAGGGLVCVPAGRPDGLTNGTSGNAITVDGGNNIDPGTSCGLSATGDKSSTDPKLVPLADNGGPTQTQALIAGSPALRDPASSNCPTKDQRGDPRGDGTCDIGAFEAQPTAAPSTSTTGAASNLTSSSADLAATINLSGDAGGFHFLYGTSSDQSTWTASPEAPAGVVSTDTPVTESLPGLSPGTTYYFAAVADNSTASVEASNVEQFTTPPGPPIVSLSYPPVDSITDTTAKIDFTIDPQGADTTYYVKYGTDAPTQQTDSGTAPAASGAQRYSSTLTNLIPGSTYFYEVVATNSAAPDGVISDEGSFQTDPQVTGTVGSPVSVTDSGVSYSCPAAPPVSWGDGQSDQQGQVTCTPGSEDQTDYQITDSHTYAAPGQYQITFNYGEGGTRTQYAEISPASTPSNPPAPPNPPTTSAPSTTTTPGTPSTPTVSGGAPTNEAGTGAGVSGVVNPKGGATSAYFQYGLDLSQRGPGASSELYNQSTPPQSVGSDSSNHTVTASLTGLIPGALYHVRLVATNGSGTTYGPDQTFKAAAAAAPPPPVLGKSEDIKPVSGTVFIRTPSGQFIPLTGAIQITSGTVIDALHGSIELFAAVGKGKIEHGIFGGAIFRVIQTATGVNRGLTTLKLLEGLFKGAPSYAICKAHPAADATIASSRTLQLLHASAHGKFRTSGRYSAATVRGTIWTIADRCDGTLTHDITHSVSVTDFVHHKTIILHAGQSYLAHKP